MASVLDIHVLTCGHILKNLKFIDLIHVADSNAHLQEACRLEFSRCGAKKEIILRMIETTPEYSDETDDKVVIYGLKTILQSLRIFGDLIENVTISFNDHSIKTIYVVKYLCLFCSFSLKRICFQNLFFDIIRFFTRSFLKLEEIVFVSCILSESFDHLTLFFPNVKIMDFHGWNSFCGSSEYCQELVNGCEYLQSIEKFGIIVRCYD